MREIVNKTIDNELYYFVPLPAQKGIDVLTRLSKLLGDTLLLLVASKGTDKLLSDTIDQDVAAFAVRALLEKLDSKEVMHLINTLFDGVSTASEMDLSKQSHFDTHFQGRLFHLMKVLQMALEVNFSDFLDALRSRTSRLSTGK